MKKLLTILLITALILCVVGCSEAEGDVAPHRFNDIGGNHMYHFVDPATGVNYIIVDGYESVAVCPRYNPDGTLYVSEVE